MNSIDTARKPKRQFGIYVLWLTIVLFILSLGYVYIGWRLIEPAILVFPWNIIAWSILALLFVLPFISSLLMRYYENWTDPFSWIAYVSLGFLSLIFTLSLLRDLSFFTWYTLMKGYIFSKSLFSATVAEVKANPSAGQFLLKFSNFVILGVSAVLTAYGIFQARRKPSSVRIAVPIAGLPAEFNGFKIVQITDIHAGLTVKRNWIEKLVREIRNLQPDLIAFTGDLADGTVPHLSAEVAPLRNLHAPYGKFFITGNHEYYSGVGPWIEEAGRLGFDVLINEHRLIHLNGSSIVLAGVTDSSGGQFFEHHRSDPKAAVQTAPQDKVKILLAHQPRTLYKAESMHFNLILSGHTHGGQFFPWNFVASIGQPYISGLHNHRGTWIYVSKGTGYWGPPLRLGARSEITVITLQQATN